MEQFINIKSVSEYDAFYHKENLHPMVSIIDFEGRYPDVYASTMSFGFYAVYLKDTVCGDITYGKSTYDYQDKSLVFVAPGQVINISLNEGDKAYGMGLLFHPDLIRGTSLGRRIDSFNFFSYQSNEALHISEKERRLVVDCFDKIKYELELGTDKHSKKLIASNIELFLDYCERFYDRQFITRSDINKGVIGQFEMFLNDYFQSEKPQTVGLPTVNYFAGLLHLSPNYFGDVVKKETGKSAHEYIQLKTMDIAKEKILNPNATISEIAYELGFRYPAHFTRAFKKNTGLTPLEYRSLN